MKVLVVMLVVVMVVNEVKGNEILLMRVKEGKRKVKKGGWLVLVRLI